MTHFLVGTTGFSDLYGGCLTAHACTDHMEIVYKTIENHEKCTMITTPEDITLIQISWILSHFTFVQSSVKCWWKWRIYIHTHVKPWHIFSSDQGEQLITLWRFKFLVLFYSAFISGRFRFYCFCNKITYCLFLHSKIDKNIYFVMYHCNDPLNSHHHWHRRDA